MGGLPRGAGGMIAMRGCAFNLVAIRALCRGHALLPGGWRGWCWAAASAMAAPAGPAVEAASMSEDAFTMPDGARLPYRVWLPQGRPVAVVLALHGFNDSRDAWEYPAPGVRRRRGRAAIRRTSAASARRRAAGCGPAPTHGGRCRGNGAAGAGAAPGVKLVLMGESMGAAVLMVLATGRWHPRMCRMCSWRRPGWGRARMNSCCPARCGWRCAGAGSGADARAGAEWPSDNREALIRLSTDPLTIRRTRVDALGGLVDLMDAALAAAPECSASSVPGRRQERLVPPAATAETWRALPAGGGRAAHRLLSDGYHLLMRDHDRALPVGDIVAWIAQTGGAVAFGGGTGGGARGWQGRAERALSRRGRSALGTRHGPVAQLDRASPSEGEGRTFESCRVRQGFQGVMAGRSHFGFCPAST